MSDLGTIQRCFQSNRVHTDRDLPPVRAVTDCQARYAASPTGAQVNDAPRKLRRRHASGHSHSDVGESRRLVRSEKACVTGGGSSPGLEAKPLEFRTKVMNGKV